MTAQNAHSDVVLQVEDLRVAYRIKKPDGRGKTVARAVDGVSIAIVPGETLAIVGESGSGKTSLANAIMRLIESAGGRIVFEGTDITNLRGRSLRAIRPRMQMIFQDPFESLDPRRTVFDIVEEPLRIHHVGSSDEERRELVLQALAHAGLTPPERIAARYAHQLSGGQRQRVAIASAMILKPTLVVADEPVSMLDVSLRAGILKLMAEMRDELGASFLFITHDLSLAWMFADRIAVMYLGRVVEEGTAVEVIEQPAHPYTRALISVIPAPEAGATSNRQVLTGDAPNPAAIPDGCRFHTRCPLYRQLGEPSRCRDDDPLLHSIGAASPDSAAPQHRTACHFAETTTTQGAS